MVPIVLADFVIARPELPEAIGAGIVADGQGRLGGGSSGIMSAGGVRTKPNAP